MIRKTRTAIDVRIQGRIVANKTTWPAKRPIVPTAADNRRGYCVSWVIIIIGMICCCRSPNFARNTKPREAAVKTKLFYISVIHWQLIIDLYIISSNVPVIIFYRIFQVLNIIAVRAINRSFAFAFEKHIGNPFKSVSERCFFAAINTSIFSACV